MERISVNKDRRIKIQPIANNLYPQKLPPQARELEEAVLGAIMLEKGAFDTAIEMLKPECFYAEANVIVFKMMQQLQERGQPIDMLTVIEELKANDSLEVVGGPYYITKLTHAVQSAAHIEAHARIILQKFIKRSLIKISGEIISEAYADSSDVFDVLNNAEEKIFDITNNFLKTDYTDMGSALAKAITRIDELRVKKEELSGVPTGFTKLDHITYGWQSTDLIILAARPSVGKTTFALNLARNAALSKIRPTPVAFFSLEMSTSQLVQRILSAESEVPLEKINRGRLEQYEYEQLHKKGIIALENAPLFIDDTPALNIFEFRAKARRLVNKHNVGLIIIDYLQLMSGTGERGTNREQEISNISRSLKALAKELNVPIIALSQLNRALESRSDKHKMPQLSDLRESGAIEQDADMVMFIYRAEYHEQLSNEMGESTKGETFIKIAKHRNGSLAEIKLRALLHIQKFEEDEHADALNSNLRPIASFSTNPDNGAKFFIQGSKMNDQSFEEEPPPF